MTTPSSAGARVDAASMVLVALLAVTLIIGFVTLTVAGIDTTTFVVFAAGPLMTTIVGAVLSHKVTAVASTVAAVSGTVDKVQEQTNGLASATLIKLDSHLTAQDITAADVADIAAKRANTTGG